MLVVLSIVMTLVYLGLVVWLRPDIERDIWIRVSLIPMTVLALALWYPWLSTITRTHLSSLGRLVQWIAWISYPLYLLHYPWRLTIEGLVGAIGRDPVIDVIVTIGYLVGAVWLAGRWHVELEQPIMNLRMRA
jgi:peptidoglycan/LPS O-acetylase OafA/YrhL